MKQPRRDIVAAVNQRLDSGMPRHQIVQEIAAYLSSSNRTSDLEPIMRDVVAARARGGHLEVVAISAHLLSDQTRRDVEAEAKRLYPRTTSVVISQRIDPSVVGGIRLQFPGQQLDLSVRSRLNHLKQAVQEGSK